jgi:hypothetical protein
MGCWNETCAITQMPIHVGDPVVLVFLTKVDRHAENHNGFCNVNDIWTPKFLPVFGEYDDYGGLEEIQENWNTEYIVDSLKSELMTVRLSTPAKHTSPDPDDLHAEREDLDLASFGLSDVLEQIHSNKVWVPGVQKTLPVGWCMMHRWVWDHMTRILERDWRPNITLDTVVAHGEAYYDAMLMRHAQVRESSEGSALGMLLKYSRRALVNWENSFHVFGESGSQLDNYGTLTGIRNYDEVLWKLAEAGTPVQDAQVQQVLRALAELLVFLNNMRGLRKFWSPQAGKGSQNTSDEAHLTLHELCVLKIKERMREYEEQDDD